MVVLTAAVSAGQWQQEYFPQSIELSLGNNSLIKLQYA
ncbi:hypothetical protein N44_02886 [Microcystis aeruginosa NIES-44]|jgi:hypothetical protein|uniref:Uncharacterized protein n=1 Tax=Microcystis aeruginosa NIES-44 TaxID=449439 RepID=A0A0A1VYG0_MICAE|nr:hypothetical protein N44_02886 [Microcystis aeruginosa NIES-44]